MPIRINLLAEAQDLEEQRRRDPVKRAIMGAVSLVIALLLWCVILQLKIVTSNADLKKYEAKWQRIEADYTIAVENQTKLNRTTDRLASLEQLRTNRFLWGTALNALQRPMDKVSQIHVVRLKTQQTFKTDPGRPPQTNGAARVPGVPATSAEKINISIEAKDSSPQAGGEVNVYKEAILAESYFKENLQKTNGVLLTSLSPPTEDAETGKSFVKFTLQCHFPEKVR